MSNPGIAQFETDRSVATGGRNYPRAFPAFELLGARMNAIALGDHNHIIRRAIDEGRREIIGHHNLHSLYVLQRDARFARFYDLAHWISIDGMPLVWLGRLRGLPLVREHRTTCIDSLPPILAEAAERGWRVFHLGSAPGVGEQAERYFAERLPGLQLRTHHGYFDMTPGSRENEAVLAAIRDFRPAILMVGMGMPRQEYWIHDNWSRLEVNAVLPVGAAFAYWGGAIPTPPRWMGWSGLEWLYRLVSEPRRLWRRYLVEPWSLLGPLVAELRRPRSGMLSNRNE